MESAAAAVMAKGLVVASPQSSANSNSVMNSSTDSAKPGGGKPQVGAGGVGNGNSDDDSGCVLEEYSWVPPGLKAEQVTMRDGVLKIL